MTTSSTSSEIPKAYDPGAVEQRIYDLWVRGGYFAPQIDGAKDPFVVIMPPPNVTGELHLGHALTAALEDLMIRWHRMKGEPTLYLPGTDHAGIATQVVVERMLADENLTRHQIGREKFLERVWEWVDRYGNRINDQLRRLGASCDWSRQSFTLDPGPQKAVRTTFVNLYKKDLIYRGERTTNWCPRCATALSDLEVKHEEEDASLYYIRYRLEDGEGWITIATTRPETLLGDTAVAVNPSDERYARLIGKNAVLPVLGRLIPIIADEAVDPEFGTGALKVTPGHDPNDFEIGMRHRLPTVNVMNLDGTMNEDAGHYRGQDRLDCRRNIVEELDRDGLLEKTEPYHHAVGHCDRCGEAVEPIVTRQWFVKVEPLARPARDAVADGRIKMVPERFAKVYFNWMDNIRDWCVSRQLWWGHRIPVWYCRGCGETIVEYEDPVACGACGSLDVHQDPDVLDTWFSSALWTHSTLGWPDQTEDVSYYYPGSVMETGYDILFFWVARMIMMGIENTGDIPFHTVYLHGLILDPEGIKMSKTRGNVMDPLDLIDLYGADALRFALTTGNSPGNNMRLNEQKLEASRNFANKLWNAARFVLRSLDDSGGAQDWSHVPSPTHREDRWILSRLGRATVQVQTYMEEYQFGEAQRVLHDFLWSEYCDWYIEMAKVRLRAGDQGQESPIPVLAFVLEQTLRLLHPFMPFITEEIWQTLMTRRTNGDARPDALIVASYPQAEDAMIDEEAEAEVDYIREDIRLVRNVLAEFRIRPNDATARKYAIPEVTDVYQQESEFLATNVASFTVASVDGFRASPTEIVQASPTGPVVVEVGGLVDLHREKVRLTGELDDLDANRDRLSKRLRDESFLQKAPEEVVERERQRLQSVEERRSRIAEILSRLGDQ